MHIRIFAVGDIFLAESPYCYGFGIKTLVHEKGPKYPFKDIHGILAGGDIVVGNLESPLSGTSDRVGIWRSLFRADPEALETLEHGHFNVVSVANNHIMEHGETGFRSTIDGLRRHGILPAGVRSMYDSLAIKNLRIGFFAFSLIGDPAATPLYKRVRDEGEIIQEISRHRGELDLVVVMLHWGEEYVHDPSPEQVRIGRVLVDHGTDIILGSHPHVLQGYEFYHGKLIVYSLGNFLFENIIPPTGRSIIADLGVDFSPVRITLDPIPIISDRDEFYPKPAKGADRTGILGLIGALNKKIQDVPTPDYATSTGDYGKLVQRAKRRADLQMKLHFIRNLHRYPREITTGMVRRYFQRVRGNP